MISIAARSGSDSPLPNTFPDLDPNDLADLVVGTIKGALAPLEARLIALEKREPLHGRDGTPGPPGPQGEKGLDASGLDLSQALERLAAAEARLAVLGDVRDRVVTLEAKGSQPVQAVELPAIDLTPMLERLAAAEARVDVLGDLRDRVVTVEAKALQPVTAPVLEPAQHVDLSPVLERLAAAEARLDVVSDLRDRVVVVETKAAQPVAEPPAVNLTPVLDRIAATAAVISDVTQDLVSLRQRVAAVEARPMQAGPAGERGQDGKDGKDGLHGKDGANGLHGKDGADGLGFDDMVAEHDGERVISIKARRGDRVKTLGQISIPVEIYRGVFVEGKSYERGDGVTWGGSEWHCNEPTSAKPGDGSKAWTLKVKKGRDGKDGRDAVGVPVVSVGKR